MQWLGAERGQEGRRVRDVCVFRLALRTGYVEQLSISIAPVVLGGGRRLSEGFIGSLNLEPISVLESRFVTRTLGSPLSARDGADHVRSPVNCRRGVPAQAQTPAASDEQVAWHPLLAVSECKWGNRAATA